MRSIADGRFEVSELRRVTYHLIAASRNGDAKGRRSAQLIGDDVDIEIVLDREASMTP